MVYDAHVHFFTKGVFKFYGLQVPEIKERPDPAADVCNRLNLQTPAESVEDLAEKWTLEFDKYSIKKAFLFGSAPNEQENIRLAVKKYPDRFTGFQMFNPGMPNTEANLTDIVSQSIKGILLFPAMHQYYPDDPICRTVFEIARKYKTIVFVHIGFLKIAIRDKLGIQGTIDEKFGDPARLINIVREFSDVNFICPHFGCGTLTHLLKETAGIKNLYLDTSSSNDWIKRCPEFAGLENVFKTALDSKTFGPERILFGSDSTVFPRGWRKEIYQTQTEIIESLGLSKNEAELVMHKNSERIAG